MQLSGFEQILNPAYIFQNTKLLYEGILKSDPTRFDAAVRNVAPGSSAYAAMPADQRAWVADIMKRRADQQAAAAAPAPTPVTEVRTTYEVPALPTIPGDLFPKAAPAAVVAAPVVTTAAPTAQPMVAAPLTMAAQPLAPSPTYDVDLTTPTTVSSSAMPQWLIPAAIGGAALLLLVPKLLKRR